MLANLDADGGDAFLLDVFGPASFEPEPAEALELPLLTLAPDAAPPRITARSLAEFEARQLESRPLNARGAGKHRRGCAAGPSSKKKRQPSRSLGRAAAPRIAPTSKSERRGGAPKRTEDYPQNVIMFFSGHGCVVLVLCCLDGVRQSSLFPGLRTIIAIPKSQARFDAFTGGLLPHLRAVPGLVFAGGSVLAALTGGQASDVDIFLVLPTEAERKASLAAVLDAVKARWEQVYPRQARGSRRIANPRNPRENSAIEGGTSARPHSVAKGRRRLLL